MFTQISKQYDDVTLSLSKDDTIWGHFSLFTQTDIPFVTDLHKRNKTTKNVILVVRLVLVSVAIVCALISQSTINFVLFTSVWVIVLFISIGDCNYGVFLDGLTTFEVYYKVVNIMISQVCLAVIFSDSHRDDDMSSTAHEALLIFANTLVIFGNTGVVFLISILDGFPANLAIKLMIGLVVCSFYAFELLKLYLCKTDSIFGDKSEHTNAKIFGINIDWRLIGMSTLFSSQFWILKQYFRTTILGTVSSTVTCRIPMKIITNVNLNQVLNTTVTSTNQNEIQMANLNARLLINNDENDDYDYDDNDLNESLNSTRSNSRAAGTGAKRSKVIKFESEDLTQSNKVSSVDGHASPFARFNTNADGNRIEIDTITISEDGYGLNLSASKMIRKICRRLNYSVEIYSKITVLYIIFDRILKMNSQSSLSLARKFTTRKFLKLCIVYAIIFVTTFQVLHRFVVNYSFTIALLNLIFLSIETVNITLLFCNLNYQIFFYHIQSFQTWWILFDSITLRVGMILINQRENLSFWRNDYDDYQAWTSYVMCVLAFIIDCLLIPISVSMIQGIVGTFEKLAQFWINLVVITIIIVWLVFGISCLLLPNEKYVILFGDNIEYAVSLNRVVFIKSIDMSFWFMVQLYRQNKHPNMIIWKKIKCEWSD